MSYSQNRQTGPQIYNYAGTSSIGSYIAPSQSINVQPGFRPDPYTTNNTSHPLNLQPASNVQPSTPPANQENSQLKGSTAQETVSNDKRFSSYNHVHEYKYNLFSLIDEPWNRCLQVGKCGSFPGNECITRQSRRGLWNWN